MSSNSSAVGPLVTLGLVDDLGVRSFDFSVESLIVMTLIDVDLEDLSDLPGFRPLSRSVTGEIDVAGAAIISPIGVAASSLYRRYLPRCGVVDGLAVLPSPVPNSAVCADVASALEAAPDELAVEGASNTPPRAGSMTDPIRLITYQRSL